jgi:hypothetical protein
MKIARLAQLTAGLIALLIVFPTQGQVQPANSSFSLLVFSKRCLPPRLHHERNCRHQEAGRENDFKVNATEDSAQFTPTNLAKYKVIVFSARLAISSMTTNRARFKTG